MRSESVRMCPQRRSVCAEGSCRSGADELDGASLTYGGSNEERRSKRLRRSRRRGLRTLPVFGALPLVGRCVRMAMESWPGSVPFCRNCHEKRRSDCCLLCLLGRERWPGPMTGRRNRRGARPWPASRSNCAKCLIRPVKTARLATDRPGVLAAVEPKEGDAVHEEQIVARLMDEVAQASLDVAKLVADDHVEIQYATKLNAVDTAEYEKDLAGQSAAPEYRARSRSAAGQIERWKRSALADRQGRARNQGQLT